MVRKSHGHNIAEIVITKSFAKSAKVGRLRTRSSRRFLRGQESSPLVVEIRLAAPVFDRSPRGRLIANVFSVTAQEEASRRQCQESRSQAESENRPLLGA